MFIKAGKNNPRLQTYDIPSVNKAWLWFIHPDNNTEKVNLATSLKDSLANKKQVLDVGAGNGAIWQEIKNRGGEIPDKLDLLDFSKKLLFQAKQKLGDKKVRILWQDVRVIDKIANLESGYDVILCSHLLSGLEFNDQKTLLSALFVKLQTKGKLIIVQPHLDDRLSEIKRMILSAIQGRELPPRIRLLPQEIGKTLGGLLPKKEEIIQSVLIAHNERELTLLARFLLLEINGLDFSQIAKALAILKTEGERIEGNNNSIFRFKIKNHLIVFEKREKRKRKRLFAPSGKIKIRKYRL